MNVTEDINVQGSVFNVEAETKIADSFLVEQDGGSENAFKVTNTNNTASPMVIEQSGSTIFELSPTGVISNNVTIADHDARITQEVSDRTSADTTLQSNIDSEASTRASAVTTLQSNIDSEASTRASADTTLQSNIDSEASTRASADTTLQTNIDTEASSRASADTTLQSNIDALSASTTTSITALETKTQHQSADADSTKFDVASKVQWDSGEEYFAIKSRASVSVSASTTVDVPLDFKSHQYSIGTSQDGCYDVVLMCSTGDSASPFFRGTLVKYSTGTSVLYPVASYQCSVTYTQASSTLGFTFDSAQTKQFTLSWNLVN